MLSSSHMVKVKSSKKGLVFSVVVPAYNEEKYLEKCLSALTNQNFPKNKYEIIVVNNRSTDNTAPIAKQFNVRLIEENRKGVVPAKQAGCLAAKGKIIAITDADTIVPANWLKLFDQIFSQTNYVGITGPAIPKELPQWGKLIYYAGLYIFILLSKLNICPTFHGQNVAFYKQSFLQAGGLKTYIPIAEDELGLLHKIKQSGPVLYHPKIQVSTSNRRFQNGFWKFSKQMLVNYLLGYYLNKAFGKTVIPAYTDIRH